MRGQLIDADAQLQSGPGTGPLIGVGWRAPLKQWIDTAPPEVRCMELTAEHFYDSGERYLEQLGRRVPLFVHGLGLSLGTPGGPGTDELRRYKRVADAAGARWISEHVAFTRAGGVDLGHLSPLPLTRDALAVIVDNAVALRQYCGRPLILENITSHLRTPGELSETQFLGQLCERADCGLLLDVTNLYINAVNHGFDPLAWLRELDPQRIVQLHIVGFAERDGRLEDAHAAAIQPELLDLLQAVLEYAPVQAIILERDEPQPDAASIRTELKRLAAVADG
jgi:uncharacterized protein (UPF0276 family)